MRRWVSQGSLLGHVPMWLRPQPRCLGGRRMCWRFFSGDCRTCRTCRSRQSALVSWLPGRDALLDALRSGHLTGDRRTALDQFVDQAHKFRADRAGVFNFFSPLRCFSNWLEACGRGHFAWLPFLEMLRLLGLGFRSGGSDLGAAHFARLRLLACVGLFGLRVCSFGLSGLGWLGNGFLFGLANGARCSGLCRCSSAEQLGEVRTTRRAFCLNWLPGVTGSAGRVDTAQGTRWLRCRKSDQGTGKHESVQLLKGEGFQPNAGRACDSRARQAAR